MKSGDLVDLPGLEEDLLRFNRTNDVQLRAELKPGTSFRDDRPQGRCQRAAPTPLRTSSTTTAVARPAKAGA